MTQGLNISHVFIEKISSSGREQKEDVLASEEPLEIRLAYFKGKEVLQKPLSVTMRTPGNDVDLALGFLLSEGIIKEKSDVIKTQYLAHKSEASLENRLLICLSKGVNFDFKKLERHFYTSSSCGVCGKASIEAVETICELQLTHNQPIINKYIIGTLPDTLRNSQSLFDKTGGIHAAGLFDAKGELLILREDVGRHNAVDKVIGAAIQKDLFPLSNCILQVSGRTSFELVQKTLMAGIPILSAVGAPSSLAVDLARKNGMTLLGFVRGDRFNIYSGGERIT
ncbi:MAG: FdhD protein [Saprospiraceae bacterium]|jgi:FdhD protein